MSAASPSRPLRTAAAWLAAAAGTAVATATAAFPGSFAIPGVSPDHLAAFLPLLLLPLAIQVFGSAVRTAARGEGRVAQWARNYGTLSTPTKVAAVALLIGAVVHLALLPAHLAMEPLTGYLFALDAAGFLGACALTLTISRWRIPAGLCALLTVVTYAYYIQTGRENLDLVGVPTAAAELAVVPLALVDWVRQSWQRPDRRVVALVAAAVVAILATATVAQAAAGTSRLANAMGTFLPSAGGGSGMSSTGIASSNSSGMGAGSTTMPTNADGTMNSGPMSGTTASTGTNSVCPNVPAMATSTGMLMQPVPSTPPTAAQTAATNELIAQTTAGIAQYADINAAYAAGYAPATRTNTPVVHLINKKNFSNNPLANPSAPQSLVYGHSGSHWVLLGALYMTNGTCKQGPDIGGSLTDWHAHVNLCFNAAKTVTGSHPNASGKCPTGQTTHATPFMLHVYIVPNDTSGPFELSHAALLQALHS